MKRRPLRAGVAALSLVSVRSCPGAEARNDDKGVLINPSCYHLRALRDLGTAFDPLRLTGAAEHGDRLFRDLAAHGLVPDRIG